MASAFCYNKLLHSGAYEVIEIRLGHFNQARKPLQIATEEEEMRRKREDDDQIGEHIYGRIVKS